MPALKTPPPAAKRKAAVSALRKGLRPRRSQSPAVPPAPQSGVFRTARMALRMACILFFTFGLYALYILTWPLVGFRTAGRRRVRRVLLRWWGACFLWSCNMELEVEGAPPNPPFFLVANHVGYMDILVLSRILGCVFIAKDDMSGWPLMGWMMKNAQQLFIRREDFRDSARAIAEVQETLNAGDGIAVFAEARCTRGVEVVPFKAALFQAPANLGMPVHYAALHYETPPGEPPAADTIAWWRWEPLLHQMARMLRLRKSKARVRFGAAPVAGGDRKHLARASHAGVSALFEPLAQGDLPELPAPDSLPKHLR